MLNDQTISGKLTTKHNSLTNLLSNLHFWYSLFIKYQQQGIQSIGSHHHSIGLGSVNSKDKLNIYNLRTTLWESGISVSNKVLECLVIRYSTGSMLINFENFILSIVKLQIAHGKLIHLLIKLINLFNQINSFINQTNSFINQIN